MRVSTRLKKHVRPIHKGRRPSAASTKGGGLRPPPFVETFVDEAIKLLGSEAIKLLGYEAIRLYGHMAVNTELNTEFGADPIYCGPRRWARSLEGT